MLAYASSRPVIGKREQSPNTLLLIISVHVAVLAAVMSSKVDVGRIIHREPPLIPIQIAPPPPPPNVTTQPRQKPEHITQVERRTAIPKTRTEVPPDVSNSDDKQGQVAMTGGMGMPFVPQPQPVAPIRHAAQLLTPASELKPPYPASKLAAEQEATLRLALTIDDRGRVTAVQAVGYADREFLDAARRYIIAHWRYQAATEDGRPISSNLTITLRFQLDG